MNRLELSARLLATFLEELEEQVRTMNADLLALEAAPADAARLKSLFRVAHTLKGAARAAGVPLVEQACHALEALLAKARDGAIALGPKEFQLLFAAADALREAGERVRAGQDLAGSPLEALRDTLSGRARPRAAAPPVAEAAPAETAPAAQLLVSQVRVTAEKLDELMASSTQLLVAGERAVNRAREFRALHDSAARWATEWRRAGRRVKLALAESGKRSPALRALDGLENELRDLVHDAARVATDAAADARALSSTSGDVQDGVRRLRMRPFAEACEALPRVVRDLAPTSGKEVRLEIAGADVEADRAVLDGLREAIVHMVRNAVDHGIEAPSARANAGKARQGVVSVSAALLGDRIIVKVADDGAGLDVQAIRSRFEQRGIPLPGDERELGRLLFRTGLSTREQVTMISGRGVGLDIVRTAVERIRGSVRVEWIQGRGTTFTVECPPTLATIRAVLVAVGPQLVALPTASVERLLRVRPEEIKHVEGRDVIATPGGPVPLASLARLLPPLVERPIAGAASVVVLGADSQRLAIVVDELVAEQEVVLRPLSRERPLPHVSGAVLLETGRVGLVLNPASLVAAGLEAAAGASLTVAEVKADGAATRRLLVVDDSITTRTLEQSVLEAAGYEVLAAVDGAEAWRLLQEQGADLVVADIEMPRMDGFQLCEAIRASKRFHELPVVLVTALESPEHRARGLEVGADAYIGKSSFEQQKLLDAIEQLLG